MTSRGKLVAGVALFGLLFGASWGFAQTTQPAERAVGAVSRAAGSILDVVPADAWGAVGVNNLDEFDTEVMRLGQKLGLPIMFAPSGLIQMGLNITQGFNPAGGIGAIVLNGAKYPGAATWGMFQGFPVPVVLAIAASDSKALIQSMSGKETEDPNVSAVTLQGESVFAVVKGGYVLIGPDVEILKSLVVEGAAATQMATEALKPGFVKQATSSKVFIYVNAKPVLATYGPVLKGVLAFAAAAAQGAQAGAGTGPALMMMGSSYIDVLSKQVDKLLIFLDLEPNGLHLSALATFQPNTLLGKVFAAAKPSGKPLLAGLPGGTFIVAAAQEQTGTEFAQQLADMFLKPYLDAMRASGQPAMAAAASQQAELTSVRIQLAKLQKTVQMAAYALPKGEEGSLAIVLTGQFTDTAKAYELIKQNVNSEVQSAGEQQPKVKDFLQAVTYTEAAETVEGVKVHTLLVDLTQLPKLLDVPENKANEAIKVIKVLFGSDGLKVRIAVGEKNIIATLGGGETFLKDALAAAKSGKAPLATQPAVVKVSERLPKDRVSVMYISAENLLRVVDRVSKAVGEPGLPFQAGETSAPLVLAVIGDPLGLHVTLYVPTELAVSVRGMINQAQMQQQRSQELRGQTTEPKTAEPAPEF